MDHIRILKRSWEILWRYRALWLFGIILAITASGGFPNGGNASYNFDSSDLPQFNPDWNWPVNFQPNWNWGSNALGGALVGGIIALVCVLVLLGVVFTFLRYIAITATIRMVNDHEETGEKRTVGQGFRMGWARASWRIFLIDLVIGFPFTIAALVLLALAASPLLLWVTDNQVAGILGTVATIGLFFLYVLLMIVVSVLMGVFMQIIYRVTALQNLGVFESTRVGYALVRKNLKDTLLMWLVLLGVKIVYGIATLIVFLFLFLVALIIGGGLGLLGAGVGSLLGGDGASWITALVLGVPVFLVVLIIPSLIFGGWKEVYLSSSWTLAYREFMALKGVTPAEPVYDNDEIEDLPARGDDEPDVEDVP